MDGHVMIEYEVVAIVGLTLPFYIRLDLVLVKIIILPSRYFSMLVFETKAILNCGVLRWSSDKQRHHAVDPCSSVAQFSSKPR